MSQGSNAVKTSTRSILSTAPRAPLAACCGVMFALTASEAFASTWPVGSCADDGSAGTLRSVVGAATTQSGDTVDMSGLSCSTISLLTGAIAIHQGSLILQGPGA